MNKFPLIAIGVVALVVLGIGVFVVMQLNKPASSPQTLNTPQPTVQNDKRSLKDLMATTNNQQCAFKDIEASSEGSVFVSGGKMRGDFVLAKDNQITNSHLISDGKEFYLWMDKQKQGFKMSVENLSQATSSAEQNIDIEKKLDVKCESWIVDSSFFVPPSEINFLDLGKMKLPKTPATGSGNIKSSQCAVCDNLSGDAKVQCKKALSCN